MAEETQSTGGEGLGSGSNAIKLPVLAGTTAALPANTATTTTLTANANGAITAQDGVTLILNDRLLVKNEVTQANNGIYKVTQVGTAGTPYILTRTTDFDQNAEVVAGMLVVVTTGTTLADTIWELSANAPITVGTTALTFIKVSGAIDGSGTANEITYWVDVDTVGALAVATYPSLTELSYVKGATSAIQTQLNLKAPIASPTFTGTVTIPTPFTLGAVSVLPTGTELNFVDGVTSNIQTQLDTKFQNAGNSFGAAARIGTNDAFALEFETNNTLYGQIGSDGRWSIGTVAPVAGTRLTVTGIGPGTTYAARFYNSTPTDLLSIRDDGVVSINGASAVDPLTLTGIFASTQSAFTFIHSGAILWLNGNTVQSLWYIQDGSNAAFGTYNEKGLRIHTNNITRLAFSADGASLTFTNSLDLVFGSAAGNKIGTATTQKIGFYNATPIVQGASVADATDAASAITQLNLLISRIEATGLIATI